MSTSGIVGSPSSWFQSANAFQFTYGLVNRHPFGYFPDKIQTWNLYTDLGMKLKCDAGLQMVSQLLVVDNYLLVNIQENNFPLSLCKVGLATGFENSNLLATQNMM